MNRNRLLAAVAVALALPLAAAADILVTRDGATVETRGPWRVDGRRVVFSLPNGMLSSMRTDQLDLDRSAEATRRAEEAAAEAEVTEAAPETPREPVLRITEANFPPMAELPEDAEGEASGSETQPAGDLQLEVVSWDKVQTDDLGVQIFGTLRNNGRETVIGPTLSVSVYGPDGGLLALDDARINLSAIPSGRSANFRAEFPGLPDFAAVRFIPAGRGYEGRPPAASDAAEELELQDAAGVELEPELEPLPEPELEPEPVAESEPPAG